MDPVRHILVPVDPSEGARAALNYALFLAKHFGATLDVLLVVEPDARQFAAHDGVVEMLDECDDAVDEQALCRERLLQQARQLLSDLSPADAQMCRVRASLGEPVEAIVHASSSYYDLVVIGDEGEHGVHGHVVREVARRAACGVLPIRAHEKGFFGFSHPTPESLVLMA